MEKFQRTQAEEAQANNLNYENDLAEAAGNADLIIEAVPEKAAIKKQVFEEIEEHASEHCLFCNKYIDDESDRNCFFRKTSRKNNCDAFFQSST